MHATLARFEDVSIYLAVSGGLPEFPKSQLRCHTFLIPKMVPVSEDFRVEFVLFLWPCSFSRRHGLGIFRFSNNHIADFVDRHHHVRLRSLVDILLVLSTMSLNPHEIAGNGSLETKQRLVDILTSPRIRHKIFAGSTVASELRISEVSVGRMREEPMQEEGRVVFALTVNEDMMNLAGGVHGGCIAYLIDFCSSLALSVLVQKLKGNAHVITVSQSLNIVYHSPAPLGDKLRIVNTTLTAGKRASSVRTEIWSDVNHRLIASGVHIKMDPSPPKAKI